MPKIRVLSMLVGWSLLSIPGIPAAAKNPPKEDKIWAVMKPLQCLDNPWEKDWLAHHKKKAAKYPRGDEHAIIKSFFQKKGVKIWDLRLKPYVNGEPLCMTCGCERGDTLFVLVDAVNSPKMKAYGFTRSFPEQSVPSKKKP